MEVSNILKNKKTLMGLATLGIMFAHFTIENKWGIQIQQIIGSCVELFLILSGAGCFYSIQKRTLKEFFIRRFKRLIPVYAVIISIYCAYNHLRFTQPLWYVIQHNEAFISMFAFGEISGWFLVAITLFYLLTPWIYKLLSLKLSYGAIAMIAIWIISAQLEFYSHGAFYMVNNFIIVRLPAYILGMMIGKILQENPSAQIPKKFTIYGIIISLALMIIDLNFNSVNAGYIVKILAVPFAFFTSLYLSNLCLSREIKLLAFINGLSLECYLLFEKILSIFKYDVGVIGNIWITNFITIIITLFIGFILNFIVLKIEKFIKILYNIFTK